MTARDSRGIPRREFVKSAVAIGGTAALAACLDRERGGDDAASIPTGRDDPTSLPSGQHTWNRFLATDDHGNDVMARHHLLLYLDYAGDGTPTSDERETVETAFRSLERAFEWSNEGLLFTVGYSPAYFDRFDESLPETAGLAEPKALSPFEEPEFDTNDAVVHLASDHGSVLLEAEEALKGSREKANGVEMEAHLGDVFDLPSEFPGRRTGFVGDGLPAKNQDVDGIPEEADIDEDAPLYMGFKSGFKKNQASEDFVTIQEGPFAGGTTQHVSRIRLRLDDWYTENDREENVAKMFCPAHAEEGKVEGAGDNLGDSSGVEEADCVESIDEDARTHGRIGHTQKTAAAREDGSPLILRRDFDSTDRGEAGLHFLAVQRRIEDFETTREAMNGTEQTKHPTIRQRVNNGILEYTFVKRRGNFLLPPRAHRALPGPNPQ
ncbi:DUF7405 family protein [Haloarchaeobius amylolyticus]|uniref:DUF7405 family protein n=1 Tax=Haloarchaeobius amylolyticus TaxID=1198296 RepID=UPI00226E4FF2|nr:Dyp-type peroxidase domain-containing protein [Haloarchaeobius amylolyticus]